MLIACQAKDAAPETVVQEYIHFVTTGQLDNAASLCTPAGRAYLSALREVMEAADASPDSVVVAIRKVNCQTTVSGAIDTVLCQCLEYDGFEEYENTYRLVAIDHKWWVDALPQEGSTHTEETILMPAQPTEEKN
ncbi:MAG: hypothetical protein R2795_02550 [Saprospiraceae bacterium]